MIRHDKLDEKVILMEDLTEPRRKLLSLAKKQYSVDFAFAKDGNVVCKMKNGKFQTVKTADDLFQIGVDDVDYRDIYGLTY